MHQSISIYAHRGLSGRYPENTMDAFQAALEAGAQGIELDVQLSKDGQMVIIHDEKINRTTDGTGYVKDFSYAELRQFDAGSWFNPVFANQYIPTLEEVFKWATKDGNQLIINVELKNDVIRYEGLEEKVLSLLYRYRLQDRVILSSFNPESVKRLRELDANMKIGYLILGIHKNAVKIAENIGANAIHCEEAFALSQYGKEAISAGFPLRIYTVNEASKFKVLFEAGAEVIMTDYPDLPLEK
ncbi:glycerophosphodiester phosphodiesterase [Cytobacillus purgationiresistens]|uniref:Glycerophosphoryl diester phosphodiesterase n=1 Tax=Cytobacillus purgationiresistens TaxID=863449 RepID=A0ABU0AQB0_9BACI|nr:glycerophosphodiester phosphodiesterase [Cytobacillus purgationiresistens]MDQ0273463.1 glycerophosphoryl diester phosphodiesterase [Cytobacillus purgationiresistens]